jgi:hypothetical protein
MSNSKKPMKVIFANGALDSLPKDQRDGIAKQLEELFKSSNPEELGNPVERLPSGTYNCPHCGSKLEQGPVIQMPVDGDVNNLQPEQIFDCTGCNGSFFGDIVN